MTRRTGSVGRTLVGTAVLGLVVGLLAAPAAAKGPVGATIDGDGLVAPIEHSTAGGSKLTDLTGVYLITSRVGGIELTTDPPTGDLGPELVVTWDMGSYTDEDGTVHDENLIRQEVYPYAAGGPLVHTEADQGFYASGTGGGWYAARGALTSMLRSLGIPSEAELTEAQSEAAAPAAVRDATRPAARGTSDDGPWPGRGWAVAVPTALVAAVAAVAVLVRRRAVSA